MFKFHREGKQSIALVFALSTALLVLVYWLSNGNKTAVNLTAIVCAVLLVLVLQFFRVPRRTAVRGEGLVVSPCDGKVVTIEEVVETEFLQGPLRQISVFMSPVNVHINWYPIDGDIVYTKYHPGKFLVAWHPKSSTENERTTIVVRDKQQRSVLFRQIAGAVARRIIMYAKTGKVASQGEECGFIKFGSRVDILVPLDAKIKVEIGQMVTGSQSVLAEL